MKHSNLISLSGFDRILLHLACAIRRPSHWQWHWQGIQRELRDALRFRDLSPKVLRGAIVLCFFFLAWPMAAQVKPDKNGNAIHPTRLLAKYAKGTAPQAATDVLERHGMKIRKHMATVPSLVVLEIGPGAPAAQEPQAHLLTKMRALRTSGLFEYVEPDYRVQANLSPNDAAFADGRLWGLRNSGQNGGVSGADIGLVNAWDLTTGSTNVIVAVIDTGVRYTHQDLAAQMWQNPGEIPGNGMDDDGDGFVDNVYGMNAINGSGDPFDDNDHGTHVSGTIGAAANNGAPHVGVAWQVRLMACKFLNAGGSGYTSDAIECINFAVSKGARILNNSWGGGDYSQALFDAIAAARDADVLFVAAAGNSAQDTDAYPSYPSCYDLDNIISVAALDRLDNLASFSNYGRNTVDLSAPGVSIFSSTAGSDSEYQYFNGTSMAAPHVSGVAALMMSQFSGIPLPELKQRMLTATVTVPALIGRCATAGRVNAYNALSGSADGVLEVGISTSVVPPLPAGRIISLFVAVGDFTPITNATVSGVIFGGGSLTFTKSGPFQEDHIYTAELPVPATGESFSVQIITAAPDKTTATHTITFTIVVPPPNDMFANRIGIDSLPATVFATNDYATKEPGEPAQGGSTSGKSIWWSWTAPANGVLHIAASFDFFSLFSLFSPFLGVYTGSSVSNLTLVTENFPQFGPFFGYNPVSFVAAAGTTYQITADGFYGEAGDFRLDIDAWFFPTNDLFADRSVIQNWASGSTVGATREPGEPAHSGNMGGKSIWWTWTAPSNGLFAISTEGSSFDTLLGVYSGSSMSSLTLVAANDDKGAAVTSAVRFAATMGATYQLAVDGKDGASGPVYLNIFPIAPLRLSSLQRLPDDTCRIWIGTENGAAIDPERLAAISVYATTDIAQPMSAWTRLTGSLTTSNGLLWIDDPAARTLPMRFYCIRERP